jgi:NDP-4-keto-2,6-dideoxyhexose 3-C-methyltransferase
MSKYKKIEKCRICGNSNLVCLLDLGHQMLTGVFLRTVDHALTSGPLQLVKCMGEDEDVCGLLQLAHSYDIHEMYGENYGYRSGLNPSMISHLNNKVKKILEKVELKKNDLIVDIGSNDSTMLQAYPSEDIELVGIDPTGIKFHEYYPSNVKLIPDFFSSKLLKEYFPKKQAKVVTSISMFYDLESPMTFMRDVYSLLADDGLWVFEQSYMPAMLDMNSYDTVCHEHLEFYALRQIKWMTDRVGFIIHDIEFNEVNGGSFSITVGKNVGGKEESPLVEAVLSDEVEKGLTTLEPYIEFSERVKKSKSDLLSFIHKEKYLGKTFAAIGASTKGNVVLQYCELSEKEISFVAEVNQEKFGCYTPGTWIPIISEADLITKSVDYLIVFPWHLRRFFETNPKFNGMSLVFILPSLEIVTVNA